MKNLKAITSILLLLVLGFALGEEAFGGSKHVAICESESSFFSPDSSSSEVADEQAYGESRQEKQSQKCNDPCHVGQSHFGHCSFLTSSTVLRCPTVESFESKCAFSQVMIEGPTLEGLRRPPRHV